MLNWARLVVAHSRFCLVASALLTIALASGLPQLGFDIDPNATFHSDNQVSQDLDRMHETFGPDDNDVVLLLCGDALLRPPTLAAMRTLGDSLAAIEGVDSVASVFDLRKPGRLGLLIPKYLSDSFDPSRLADQLHDHPLAGQFISDDGKVITLVVRMQGQSLTVSSISETIRAIEDETRKFQADSGVEVYLAGHPAIRADVLVTVQRAMLRGCIGAGIVAFLVALVLFQRPAPVIAVVSAPLIGSLWTFGLVAWAQAPVGGLLSALPNLVFVVGLTDAVHLVLEYRRQLTMGGSRGEAVTQSLIHVGPACWLTSLTTFIGFGSLALSRTSSVQEFGIWAAVGTSLVLFAVVFTLPAILLTVPAEWMRVRRGHERLRKSWIVRWVAPTMRHPGMTTLIGLILVLLLCYPALNQRPDIVWTEAIPDDSSSVMAMRKADESIGGALPAYIMLTWPEQEAYPSPKILQAASEAQKVLREAPKFCADFSILNLIAAAPGASVQAKIRALDQMASSRLDPLLNVSRRSLLVSARVPNDGAFALSERLRDVDDELDKLAEAFPGFRFVLTGTVVAASRNMNAIILDLARSLAIAAVLIFLVFTVAFRSLRMGLISIVPNVLPLLVVASGLKFAGYPLQITSAVTFSLCLGLAVDDTIHVLVRFRTCRRNEPDARQAMEQALSQVGPALVVTTLILLGGFLALMTSSLPSIQLFSILSSAILITALVGDLLLFPGMLVFAESSKKSG